MSHTGRIRVFEGNQGAVQLAQKPITNSNSKHIDVRQHFLRELVGRTEISIVHVPSPFQHADFWTKAISRESFEFQLPWSCGDFIRFYWWRCWRCTILVHFEFLGFRFDRAFGVKKGIFRWRPLGLRKEYSDRGLWIFPKKTDCVCFFGVFWEIGITLAILDATAG